ncbi:helix-turn-helix domain-containing protein [Singulisphaera acidiphila]|uniref:Putative transcriptional regulator n=1 Tax=Singulisphaera acidiphila (strain ATCC BAA-1392 / DSM 18658 / VKM B-2454 / MOB10) TaxID=886293 RepID=L0DB20_SINAD|nr:helix-turn-helix domain-containing protein [Singulisphaera acidiphila]AGA26038.1 putative transcriptional regulator [Singulisphaera acidiphila DSM 18658]
MSQNPTGVIAESAPSEGRRKFARTEISPPNCYTAADVRRIRDRLSLSQRAFASLLGADPASVSAWEQDRRRPSGTVRRILDMIEGKNRRWEIQLRSLSKARK